jgi:16S rRNA (cytidine1402-2'-O)-methyltransferase
MSKLTLVPTPVGNLEDITLRALQVLKQCDVILAEDTRTTAILLNHYGIRTPMISHHKFNEHSTVDRLVERIQGGEHLALVSDAGTPGLSDPGYLLVRHCLDKGVEVECLPGATALIPSLIISGLPCDRFHFEGFLPVKKGRQTRLAWLSSLPETFVLYESPYRLVKTLEQFSEHCGKDRPASVTRELSKRFEQTVRGSLEELIAYFTENTPRGELVVVIAGKE